MQLLLGNRPGLVTSWFVVSVTKAGMFEIDFLPVGNGEKSGDAITMRYSNPGGSGYVVGVVDAGFFENGEAVVEHVDHYYDTDSVDFVLSTHPDEDHISGLETVMRGLHVSTLLIHRPAQHDYPSNTGARPAEELVKLATAQGTQVVEPFAGVNLFGGSFLIAGPTEDFYEQMLSEQETTRKPASAAPSLSKRSLGEAAAAAARRALDAFPGELFFDDAGGTNPRNNSSVILSLLIEGRHLLFPSDAGVPAITNALDYLDTQGRTSSALNMLALPHHGSRHNLDRATIERLLGGRVGGELGTAVASVAAKSEMPSPRVANAVGRRGYPVFDTKRKVLCHSEGAPPRAGWSPATALPPLVEDDHD